MIKLLSKPNAPYRIKIGQIKIEAKELIGILKKNEFSFIDEIVIKNKNYEFHSLEDAESNLELLLNKPEINIRMANNSFRMIFKEGAVLKLDKTASDDDVIVFDKIASNLAVFRAPFYFLGSKALSFVWFLLLILTLTHGYLFKEVADIYENNQTYVIIKRTMSIISFFGMYISFNLNSSQVILKHRRNILNDIHDKAISSLALFLAGGAFYWIVTNLGTRP